MSDERLDALAESARNRGLKLVRSRVRTPGKRRFGKVGLTDAAGKPVFGMDDKGPTAKPEDVEDYLRTLGAKDWGESLGVAVLPRKRRRPAKAQRAAANDTEPAPKSRPKPPPKPVPKPKPPPPPPKPRIRTAKPGDAQAVTELIRYLGHEITEKAVRKNITALNKIGEAPLLAVEGTRVIGLCGVHKTPTVHRDAPLGRLTILAVAEDAHKRGIGRMLVEAAEQALRKMGCKMVEVTSNDRRARAHAFYRHLGYERTSMRFIKTL